MNTILFYIGITAVVLVILTMIPGVRMLILPIILSGWRLIHLSIAGMSSWVIWFVKSILNAHFVFFTHLIHKPETIDPTVEVETRKP